MATTTIAGGGGRPAGRRSATAVDRVRDSLRGDVAAVYRDLVPALNGLPTARVYDLILGHPEVLDGCFRLFRARRAAFAHLLVDADGALVESETARLSCGRAVADIIGLALRTMARRYLRARLGGPTRQRLPEPTGLGPWLARLLGRRRPPRTRLVPGPGDRLYEALRDRLRHEWQAGLVPYYAPLPVSLVRELGDRLLDYRSPEDLEALAAAHAAGVAPRRGDGTGGVSGGEARRLGGLREEDIWAIYQQAGLQSRLGLGSDQRQGRRLVALAASVGPAVDHMLREDLGLDRTQMVAATCACAEIFGPDRFLSLFAEPGEAMARAAWREALADSRLSVMRSPDQVAEAARTAAMMAAAAVAASGA